MHVSASGVVVVRFSSVPYLAPIMKRTLDIGSIVLPQQPQQDVVAKRRFCSKLKCDRIGLSSVPVYLVASNERVSNLVAVMIQPNALSKGASW